MCGRPGYSVLFSVFNSSALSSTTGDLVDPTLKFCFDEHGYFFLRNLTMWMTEFQQIFPTVQKFCALFWGCGVDSHHLQRKEKTLKFWGAAGTASGQHLNLTLSMMRKSLRVGYARDYISIYFPRIVGIMNHHRKSSLLNDTGFFRSFSPLSSVVSLQGWLSRIWLWCWGANMPVLLACGLGDVQQTLNG